MYQTNDTIVTIASGPGGAIGIIRLSGNESFKIASSFLQPNKCFENPRKGYHFLKIVEDSKIIDNAIVLLYIKPKSYTGEDMVEIFCHNSPYIVRKTLELALRNGARQAREGEFTFRAYINGKIDLTQAEAINQLIKAETQKQHEIALRQAQGSLSKKLSEIKNEIIDLLSEVEVRIDDSYEEIENIDMDSFYRRLDILLSSIKKLKDTYHNTNFLREGIKICICGSPNCGKSTLLNTITGYERVITSPIPGTTRDVIEVIIEIRGFKTIFYDTAGIRETDDILEKEGIKKTLKTINNSDIVILLQDPFQNKEEYMKVKEIVSKNMKTNSKLIEVITKSDMLKEKPHNKMYISSLTGENIEKLIHSILDEKEKIADETSEEIIVCERHYQSLTKTYEELKKIKTIESSHHEIIAEHLKNALDELESIAGKTLSEDIINNIFSKFCVGK